MVKWAYIFFFNHQWKSFLRNDRWKRNILNRLILSVFIIYFLLFFLFIGINIDVILSEFGTNKITTFNSILIFYLIADLLFRFLFQNAPTTYFAPYLRFRLRHASLANLMVIRSLFSFFNIIPWFIIIPFSVKILSKNFGFLPAIIFLLSFSLLVLINNYITLIIKFTNWQLKIIYLFSLLIILSLLLVQGIRTYLLNLSAYLGSIIIEQHFMVLFSLLLTLIIILYFLRKLLISGFYLDGDFQKDRSEHTKTSLFLSNHFSKLGLVGDYMHLELRLLLRNKRPIQTFLIYPVFPVYLIIMLLKIEQDVYLTLVMLNFTFGFLSLLYGQYLLSWESSYFDLIMVRKLNFCHYLKAKYYLMIAFSFIILIVLMPLFVVLLKGMFPTLIAMFIFTIGTTNFIIMFSGIFNKGRLLLNESFVFNYQGFNLNQLILPLFVFAIPVGVYFILQLFYFLQFYNLLLIIIGSTFVVSHNWWISVLQRIFSMRKYRTLEGSRKRINYS